MSAIFFSISEQLPLMIIPDTLFHSNGHEVITYTYSVFKDVTNGDANAEVTKSSELHLQKHDDPNYMGYITFEDPGRLFSYTADGAIRLELAQVEEIIEHISHYRDNPNMWRHLHH